MKLAIFDAQTYDREALAAANARYAHDLTFFEPRLTHQTASMAMGYPAVCSFVNDRVDAETLATLQAGGTRLIALRSAGYNHVDLDEAGRRGFVVVRVPEYSPHAVAEHTVGLVLALNRRTCESATKEYVDGARRRAFREIRELDAFARAPLRQSAAFDYLAIARLLSALGVLAGVSVHRV